MKRKTALTAVLALLLVSMTALTFFPAPVRAAASIDILTNSGWLDSVGFYHVSGEVENVGDTHASSIQVNATFYDSSDTEVATSSAYTLVTILLPQRRSPFEVLLTDIEQAAKVDHYSLSLSWAPFQVGPPPMGLEILSNSSFTDIVGHMHVVGEIKNIEIAPATNVLVIATFYNSTGTVVATGSEYSSPSSIDPDQTAPFDVRLAYLNRVSLVASYVLTAQSDQYAIVPEFPSIIVLPLFALFTLLAAVFAKKSFRSEFEKAYRDYMSKTGRFLPRLGRRKE